MMKNHLTKSHKMAISNQQTPGPVIGGPNSSRINATNIQCKYKQICLIQVNYSNYCLLYFLLIQICVIIALQMNDVNP